MDTQQVLEILARHKVVLPVGALLDLGARPALMSLAEMRAVAAVGGTVRWSHSGVVERLAIGRRDGALIAWGHWTRPHPIGSSQWFSCTPAEGLLTREGDPDKVPPTLLRPSEYTLLRPGRR